MITVLVTGLDILLAFSLRKTVPRVLSARHPTGSYPYLHGIRLLAFAWIVLGHAWHFGTAIGPEFLQIPG